MKNIYKVRKSYKIEKSINNKKICFGYFRDLEDAKFFRDLLAENDWDSGKLNNIQKCRDEFLTLRIENNKITVLNRYESKEEALDNMEFDQKFSNSSPNKYIYKRLHYFDVEKSITGKKHRFAICKNLEDARFLRDLLIENDWQLDRLPKIAYFKENNEYVILFVSEKRVQIAGRFDSRKEAQDKYAESVERFSQPKNSTGYSNISKNGNSFAVSKYGVSKINYFGTFPNLEDAVAVRELLIDLNWDISQISSEEIYEISSKYYKFAVFDGKVKIVAKYENQSDAYENNASESLDGYSTRNIWFRDNRFFVMKRIDGQLRSFGSFDLKEDAVRYRDELIANDWIVKDEESLFSLNSSQNEFEDIVNSLTMWEKLIYDTVNKLDNEFIFEDVLNHSNLKRYKMPNFEKKVQKNLDNLCELGLVDKLGEKYCRLW